MQTLGFYQKEIFKRDGVDILFMYCRATGWPIGMFEADMWKEVLIQFDESMSDEEIMDDLAIRHLAFCRPSPLFNLIRADSLDRMRLTQPKRLLCYLMNRLYYARFYTVKNPIPFEQMIRNTRAHIQMANVIDKISDMLSPGKLNRLLLALLEVDSMHGLHNFTPPRHWPHFASIQNDDALDAFITVITDWAATLRWEAHKAAQRGEVRRESSVNPAAKVAFVKQFTESAPPSKAAVAKQAKQTKLNDLLALVGDILDVDNSTPSQPVHASTKPSFKPKLVAANPGAGGRLGSTPVRFGVKS